MEKMYANALASALQKGADEKTLADGLIAHLKSVGRAKLLPGIARELTQKLAREAKLAPMLEVASQEEEKTAVKEAKEAGIDAGSVTVNADLIRGWRVQGGGTLIDRSGKKTLIELYRNIITK